MAENLMCKTQKSNSQEFLDNYDRIFSGSDLKEVAVFEIGLDMEGRIKASEVKGAENA